MAEVVDKYMEQTVLQVEVTTYSDGRKSHRLVKAFSSIIGEEKAKKPVKKKTVLSAQEADVEYL